MDEKDMDSEDEFDQLFHDEAEEVTESDAEAEEKAAHWPNLLGSSQNQPLPPLEHLHPHALAQLPPNQQLSLAEYKQQIEQLQQQLEAKDQQIAEIKNATPITIISTDVQPERERVYENYHGVLNEILAWACRIKESVKTNCHTARDFGETETKEDIPECFQPMTLMKHIKRTETFGTNLKKELESLPAYIESLMNKLEDVVSRNHWDRVVGDKYLNNNDYAEDLTEVEVAERKATKKRKEIKSKQKAGIKRGPLQGN
jgi:hypothetical protein